jgi:hypothetical protein
MIHYDDPALKHIEDEIIIVFDDYKTEDYTQCECLLRARKYILNEQALAHQAELLPNIIAFNDALTDALKRMYDRAHEVYAQVATINPDIELSAKCYLNWEYPTLHPYQADDRQNLWGALQDSGWNPLYENGVSFTFELPRDKDEAFDSITGMDCPPPNWNEGLDVDLTKDLHLINAFHNLFDHTNFALTDFIFVREFTIEINIYFEEKV